MRPGPLLLSLFVDCLAQMTWQETKFEFLFHMQMLQVDPPLRELETEATGMSSEA